MRLRFSVILLSLFSILPAFSQNITDMAVMNEGMTESVVDAESVFPAIADSVFLNPGRIRYDDRCFQIEGRDEFVFSGSFHYFRTPRPLWKDRFSKLKAAGFNCVETYVPWNWHERVMPRSSEDFSCADMTDLVDFLNLASEYGLYVIIRPGPYICAEWSGGGFPQWIMQKKPAKTEYDVWLQSNDPEFVKWNEHWYKTVCRTVAPYQITRRNPGEKGVILFQIENEFNRIKWFPGKIKKQYLENLATIVRDNGIEVPIITCWTNEARNVAEGPLNGVVDMVNSYPKWNVEKSFGRLITQQEKTQPGKPLISGELQGGWMSEVGGKLSWEQDGLAPVQTQNITLYALQRGFCAINHYMVVGGTNLDDWGARQMTTTYDYAAAISEDGSTNERYRRFQGLSSLLHEHGTRIARANLRNLDYTSTDPDVELVVRETENGDRYYFIRTEEHTRHHFGTVMTADITLDFSLEPFGSKVYYLPKGADSGIWYPEVPEAESRPAVEAHPVTIVGTGNFYDALPDKWNRLRIGETIDSKGIYGRHPIYYRFKAFEGGLLEVGYVGNRMVNGTDADDVLLMVDGNQIPALSRGDESITFRLPGDSLSRKSLDVVMLYETIGLHHHTNASVEKYWAIGPSFVRCNGADLSLRYAYVENVRGLEYSRGQIKEKGSVVSPIQWHTYSFDLSTQPRNASYPYYLRLEHTGNGFIYVNGHCIGRCWEKGPQTDYYIPECWLDTDGENHLAISLLQKEGGAGISKIEIIPCTWKAERVFARQNGFWGDQGDGTYRNPVIAADYCDPDPLRVGKDYYMVSSTFESHPGVSILHSKDLVNWTSIGAALTDLASVDVSYTFKKMERYNGGVYAPTLSYHNGKYYIYVNLYTDGFYVATSDNPAGPWKSDFVKDKNGRPLRVTRWSDPCPFWDEDGKAYLVASHPGRKYWYSYIFQMSEDGTMLFDADSAHMDQKNFLYRYPDGGTVMSPYHSSEGNRLFKRNGYYYFQHIEFTDQGQGEGTYIFRSRNLYGTHPDGTPGVPGNPGEYEKYTIERVTSRDSLRLPGQGGYVDTPDGRWFWIGQFTRNESYGRAPNLVPVTWKNDWPVIGADIKDMQGEMVWQYEKPVQGYGPSLPHGSDDFDSSTLHPMWMWNHVPDDDRWSLSERQGYLTLYASPTIGGAGFFKAANTLCQRYMRSESSQVTVGIDLSGMKDGQKAGLAHFNGGVNYAYIGVMMTGRALHVIYEHDGECVMGPKIRKGQKVIYLRTDMDITDDAVFSYSLDGREFTDFGEEYHMTAANFRGDMIGVFTYNDVGHGGYVDVDWFDYKVENIEMK